jgi:uncharacterized delta-60 repeat protein
MKKSFILIAIIVSFLLSVKSNAQIDTSWTLTFGNEYWNEMHGIATDQNGNAYVAGWTYFNTSNYDWAIAKCNANGTLGWLRTYSYNPGSDIDATELIASDPNGDVIAVGTTATNFLKLIKYNPQGDTVWTVLNTYYYGSNFYSIKIDYTGNIYLAGYYDNPRKALLIKYNQNGVQQWAKEFNSQSGGYSGFADVVIDNIGSIYAAGRCEYDTATFDVLLVKYNSQGDTIWARHWNGPGTYPLDEATKVSLDALGNIFIGGRTSASLQTPSNFVTLKYDTTGTFQWVKYYDGPLNNIDGIVDMVTDDLGNVIVTGFSVTAANNSDFETIKYNSNGDTVWTRRFGGNHNDNPTAMIIDTDKNIYITGYGINDFGNGGGNGLAVKYDASGNKKWVAEYDGGHNNGEDEFYDLMLDNNNDLIIAGRSYGDTSSYDFLVVKYKNSTSGIPLIENGNTEIYLSCYPNPFSNATFIIYYLPTDMEATLKLFDLQGNEIRSIVSGKQQQGNHTLRFYKENLSEGIYFCKLKAGGKELMQKLIIIK